MQNSYKLSVKEFILARVHFSFRTSILKNVKNVTRFELEVAGGCKLPCLKLVRITLET